MSDYKQRTLDFLNIEWATHIERFNRWPVEYGLERVQEQGYPRFRDMLAHILAWWEEAMPIILAIAENREYKRRKYDFDVFNAAAIEKYGNWDEQEFFAHFAKTRQKAAADLRSLNEAAWENRRVRAWVNGVFISHAREHLVALSRFLLLDTLQNERSVYIEKFNQLEDQAGFLKKQGFESLHDLLAHVIGWWQDGERNVSGILKEPPFKWEEHDTDAFNAEVVEKYKNTSEADPRDLFENSRLSLTKLGSELPEAAFTNKDIENWLAVDVIEHLDQHAMDG